MLRKIYLLIGMHFILSLITLPLGLMLALSQRIRSRFIKRPAVLFGITPIINIKYWSRSLQKLGYHSVSFVYDVYSINSKDDFDYTPEKLFPWLPQYKATRPLYPYICFLWGLANFEVFVLDFDGGFLRKTPLQFLEFPIYVLAKRKIIAVPYGSDVLDIRRCRDAITQVSLLQDYPAMGSNAKKVERRVAHYSRWASFIVSGGTMPDFLPRHDLLVPSPLAIDTEEWHCGVEEAKDKSLATAVPIKILHAPNHRNIKGTEFLIQACEQLRAEGLPIELIVKERVPNREIRELMRGVDIVASAFIMGHYELFAIEGMSMSKPVLNYWRPDLKFIYSNYSFASECPIVDTPVERMMENIRMLVESPDLRRKLGEAGRRYVERYHSYEAIGQLFDKIIRRVWWNEEVVFFAGFKSSVYTVNSVQKSNDQIN